MLGVEYFVRSGFGSLVLYCLGQIVEAIRGDLTHGNGRVKFDRSFNSEAYIMVASWLVLTVIGIATARYL
ncbi:hypothetical protein PTSG_04889 [Salpingoeca rosetta]|uniref:Uncharacterized protein n=1 Tax=Salpingoeca rosetta (strain ATCC 50818 / BSB-021) TaxID=946362 RepID=F2U8X3_SALR5|nr:uncharacterized protein PTSG_04889 [Salpingoeca rosetta]EGD73176.1 hypothetical protein PTSG_04889 [Salpingoeca rosetta]|eukprot:XP_004994207.1 hypothetical protein PTSG_04889 [Salpingoeca rosetta]